MSTLTTAEIDVLARLGVTETDLTNHQTTAALAAEEGPTR